MFVGYQEKLYNGSDIPVLDAVFVAETQEELESLPCVVLDKIEEVDFAEMYNGYVYLSEEALIKAKQDYVRSIRNDYLVEYVDGAVSNPLRWADMNQELKDMYTNYRQYLLDYTEEDNWWEQNPLTLDEWSK